MNNPHWIWTPNEVHFGPNDPIKDWTPSWLQRLLYYLYIIKDPRADEDGRIYGQ